MNKGDVPNARQLEVLKSYGLDDDTSILVLTAAIHLSNAGGPDIQGMWLAPQKAPLATADELRDELMVFNAEAMATVRALLSDEQVHDWAEQYASAFGYFAKPLLQSVLSVDLLASANCYVDGLSICRTLIGQLNLLLLFALNPWLFDDWYRHPGQERYLDGHVRDVLSSHGVEFFGRLYAELSEAIHHQPTLLAESGYFETGLFVLVPGMRYRLLTCAKLVLGAAVSVGIAVARQDYAGRPLPATTELASRALEQTAHLLDANRFEHLALTISPDRHWTPIGKNKAAIFTRFNSAAVEDQLTKFHRDTGQRKVLRAPYRFTKEDAEKQRQGLASSDTEPASPGPSPAG